MNLVSDSTPSWSLVKIFFFIVILGWIIVGQLVVGSLCGIIVHGMTFFEDLSDPINHPEVKKAFLLAQSLSSIIGLVVIPWLYLEFYEKRNIRLFFKRKSNGLLLMIIISIATTGLAISIAPIVEWNANINFPAWMGGFAEWAKDMEEKASELIKMVMSEMNPISFSYIFIVVAIIPAIGEEIVFRGLIQTELQRWLKNPHIGIWVSSAIFSAIHLQFFGFLPRLLIGVFLGYLFYWSGNLWVSIFAHLFNNGMALIAEYLYQLKIISTDVNNPKVGLPLTIVVVGIFITTISVLVLKNKLIIVPNDHN